MCVQCLSYDFIGTMIDDASDETQNVQVPTAWRTCNLLISFHLNLFCTAFVDTNVVPMFFELYVALPDDFGGKVGGFHEYIK
jgi:hypothetical protein